MSLEKINDFLNCYFDTLEIDDEIIITCIKNGIINRYNKYKDYFPTISVNDDSFKNYIIKSNNGCYQLEDFLLNRLFQSLRYIIFKNDENDQFCEFSEKNRTIYIAENAIKKVTLFTISNWPDESKELFLKILMLTVFDHELGHALKSQFDGGYKVRLDNSKRLLDILHAKLKNTMGEDKANEIFSSMDLSGYISADDIYKKLISNLAKISNSKYSSLLLSTDELIDNYSYSIGSGIDKQNSASERSLTLIDELLQETESMENINCYDIPQSKLKLGNNGNYINVFYLVSGYRFILGYGKILTSLLGIKDTFQATYLDPSPILKKFNKQYQSIAQEVFQNNLSPFTNISNNLHKIISSHSECNYLQLDLFFAKCYRQMIMQKLSVEPNLYIETLLNEIASFQMRLTTNDDESIRNSLPHNAIFNNLKSHLLQLSKSNNKTK